MTQLTIFISHNSLDHGWCTQFAEELVRLGDDIWYDARELRGGDSWIKVIEQELAARDVFIIILSPNSWNSHWCQQELQLAQVRRRRIIPVLHQRTQVTGFLETIQQIDMIDQPAPDAAVFVHNLLQNKAPAPPARPMPRSLTHWQYREETQSGTRFIIPPVAKIPAGSFKMGSDPRHDQSAQDDEMPIHSVTTAEYDTALFPVTVAEYALALRLGVVLEPPTVKNSSVSWQYQLQTPENPVVCVTWYDALAYARWLSQCSGQNWRLLTEAEWEKAARGNDGRLYPWGNVWNPAQANTVESRQGQPTSIGTYRSPGPYGLYDMCGNVWEWTATIPKDYPYAADGRDTINDEDAMNDEGGHIARGGSWDNSAMLARCAFRMMYKSYIVATDLGFRLCRSRV